MRDAELGGTDAVAVSDLVRAYLGQTEREKREHGPHADMSSIEDLPRRYEIEVREPAVSYAGCVALLAEIDGRPAGVVIVKVDGAEAEITRLWADPAFRGRGVGSSLLDAAISATDGPVRLTVWEWRSAAIGLYSSRGFDRVPSWDERPGLVCMVRPAAQTSGSAILG